MQVRASGIALLGGRRVSVVRVLDVPDELVRTVLTCGRRCATCSTWAWLPHVTLARRMDRADVGRAVEALGHEDAVLTLTSLRRWDPDAGIVTTL